MKRPRIILILALSLVLLAATTASPQQTHSIEPPERTSPAATEADPRAAWQTVDARPWLAGKIDPTLLKEMVSGGTDRRYQFIVELAQQANLPTFADHLSRQARGSRVVAELQQTARQTQAGLVSFLEARKSEGRVQQYRSFWIFNGLAVTADADTILDVAARPDVSLIREDRWQQWVDPLSVEQSLDSLGDAALQWNIARIRADQAWNILGITGSGVTVGIVDTGVDWQHPALQLQYRGYKPGGLSVHEGNWFCATGEGYFYPYDGYGHGTHVAGTAVGNQDSDGVAIGVAPGAQWIAAKALSDQGYGLDSWIHAALEWLLAPAGDPALAPDVVNCSWGSAASGDETFHPDLQALRAAGIVPVFSAGNNGPYPGTVGSPASAPEAIAVGATDDLDQVTSFSSRGPSPWGEVKPEVSAPGARIRSSLPGGIYGVANGTSMAAPHVAGLVALLLSADPTLSVDAVEDILTSTALPLGSPIPNNDTGWGRIDAYNAAAVALQAGYVSGQVTSQGNFEVIPYALVAAFDHEGQQQGQVAVDQDGRYTLALPEGRYALEASAFGYEPEQVQNVVIVTGDSVTADFRLHAVPLGTLTGQVSNAETGEPVAAQVAVEGTPALALSDSQTGEYSLPLPAGIYTVTASQNGYRHAATDNVEIIVDQGARLDFAMSPAPTLLLVDSGRWYYASQAGYYRSALDARDYVYDLWEIRSLDTDVPTQEDLAPFDITIWSSPVDSPALIGAGDVISGYLTGGGSLLLSGQDVGFWDSGASGWTWHGYYSELLKAKLVADNAGRENVIGTAGDLLDGLTLPMNGPDSAGNQVLPDLIDVLAPLDANLIANYEGIGGAALRASGCQSYRAVYLAAGLEGLGDGETRAEVMDRTITWLGTPFPDLDATLTPIHQDSVWLTSSYITYTVELQNRGQSTDRFDLELSASDWPAAVMDSGFTQVLTQSLALSPCQTQTLGVRVAVAPDAGWDVTDVVTLTARSQADPAVSTQSAFTTKTPAPILLVDDHHWYDTSARYRNALEARQLPYDQWRIDQTAAPNLTTPSLKRLEHYPVVIWFTAYDWYKTLTPAQETALSTYLDGGGRLVLSSQDYLFTSGFTDFARDYLGVINYTGELTVTQTVGAVGHPVGRGLGPTDLAYPFRNFSDVLRPSPEARIAFWGQHGQPVALTRAGAPWKTAFYAFALEGFSPDDMAAVLGDTVDWLSPLGDSTLEVSSPTVAPGSELGCTISMRNTGPRQLSNATLSNPVPPHTSLVQGSLEGPATYDPGTGTITWAGILAPGQAITVTYRLQIDQPLADGTVIENVAYLSDETGLSLERADTSRVDSPYLGTSVKIVSAGISPPGQVLTYTLYLKNEGRRPAKARLTDPVPVNSSHLPGSGWASSGLLTSTQQLLVWSGTIGTGESVTVTFPVIISPVIEGFYIHNRATLSDGEGEMTPMEAYTLVEARIFLPLVLKGF